MDAMDEVIKEKCSSLLGAEYVECTSVGGGCDGGAKVTLVVVSSKFDGVALLKRHKMVNEVFANELESGEIHALTIKAWTPKQYESKK